MRAWIGGRQILLEPTQNFTRQFVAICCIVVLVVLMNFDWRFVVQKVLNFAHNINIPMQIANLLSIVRKFFELENGDICYNENSWSTKNIFQDHNDILVGKADTVLSNWFFTWLNMSNTLRGVFSLQKLNKSLHSKVVDDNLNLDS